MFFNLIHFILTVTHSIESNEMNLVGHLKKRSILSLSNTQLCCKLYTGLQKNASHFQMKIWWFPPNPLAPSPSLLTHKMIVRQIED